MIPQVARYLESRGIKGPWEIAGRVPGKYDGAVVIPALAENESLFGTLHSLAQNPRDILSRFLVLIVVNHRENDPLADKINNKKTLERLAAKDPGLEGLPVAWVDASSPGLELPAQGGGVGMARKIGCDRVLPHLEFKRTQPLLISLDADTLVRPNYLSALVRHFQGTQVPGAVVSFCHQPGDTPMEKKAIQRYELFLRAYVLGLSQAGSPYAFHTIGSAMACSAEGYARAGGMNCRTAAEDFYFLQQMAKTCGIAQVKGTTVYPSARASHRVPFGTGRSVSRLLAGEKEAVLFYPKECFQILQEWLALVTEESGAAGETIQWKASKIFSGLPEYLDSIKFQSVWEKLRRNFRDRPIFLKGFHEWFDGLKTLKLIHYGSKRFFLPKEPEEVLPDLLQWAGYQALSRMEEQLEWIRKIQNQ